MYSRAIFPLLIIAAAVLAYGSKYVGSASSYAWIMEFLSSGALNAAAAFGAVLLGIDKIQQDRRRQEERTALGASLVFWKHLESANVCIAYGAGFGSMRDDSTQASSVATIRCVQELERVLGVVLPAKTRLETRRFKELDSTDVKSSSRHLIVLGGYLSIGELEDFPQRANLAYQQDFKDTSKRKILGKIKTFMTQISAERVTEDYAMLTIINESRGRLIIWVSGNYGLATYGTILALTNASNPLIAEKPAEGHYIQYVVKIAHIQDEWIPPTHQNYEVCDKIGGMLERGFDITWLWGK